MTKQVAILDLFKDTRLSNLRVAFGNLMNNRRDNDPIADPFDLMNDLLYIAADTDKANAIILVTKDKFTRLIMKNTKRSDRDMGHMEYFDMCDKSTTIVAALYIANEHYPSVDSISIDEAKAILAGWDELCEVEITPTVPDEERVVVVDYDDRMAKLKAKAEENGSLASLEEAIRKLSVNEYNRLTISASYDLEEVNFILESIQVDGSYKRLFNGGIIYRERSNEWTTHT